MDGEYDAAVRRLAAIVPHFNVSGWNSCTYSKTAQSTISLFSEGRHIKHDSTLCRITDNKSKCDTVAFSVVNSPHSQNACFFLFYRGSYSSKPDNKCRHKSILVFWTYTRPSHSNRTDNAHKTWRMMLYTVSPKNWATFIFTVTLANVGRFFKFFQCRNQKEMAHNKNEKFPTVA